jgi:hypothetical protein
MAGWDGLCVSNDLASYTVLLLQYSCTSASPPEWSPSVIDDGCEKLTVVLLYLRFASGMLCQVLLHICALVPWESSPIRFSSVGHQSAVARSVASGNSGNSGNRNVVFGISAFHPEVWERRYHGRCLQPLV